MLRTTDLTTLHDKASTSANGEAILTEHFAQLSTMIYGSASSFQVDFEGSLDGINYAPIRAECLETGVSAGSTSASGLFTMLCDALEYVRCPIVAIGGGDLTVTCRGRSY